MKKILGLVSCLIALSALAELPLFSITGSPPAAFNITFSYVVTNNAPYTLNNIGLSYAPGGLTPAGFTQITSGANYCGTTFSLAAGASCNLYYQINPNNLVNNIALGGPEICYNTAHPIYCSVPDAASQIHLPTTPSLLVGFSGSASIFSGQPFFIQNYVPGGIWTTGATPSPALPPLGSLLSVDCNESICVATGVSNSAPSPSYVMTSTDKGLSWTNYTLPATASDNLANLNYYKNASCSPGIEGRCLVLGMLTGGATYTSYLYQYNYLSSSWVHQTLPGAATFLRASACTTNYCVVGGGNNNQNAPVLYYNETVNNTWVSVPITSPGPPGALSSEIVAFSCESSFCLGWGGQYNIYNSIPSVYSYVVRSTDGIHWSVTDLSSLGPFLLGGIIDKNVRNDLSCSAALCVAGGLNYQTGSSKLLQSVDYGSTWTEVTTPAAVHNSTFVAASCSTSICIAVGNTNGGGQVLWQTLNGGTTWAAIPITLASTIEITTGNCKGNFCFITGSDSSTAAPVVYQTTDAGLTWAPATFNPALPAQVDFLQGA